MKSNEWYREEVAKLLAIVVQEMDTEPQIYRSYLDEKLQRILNETGIGIHPSLKRVVEGLLK